MTYLATNFTLEELTRTSHADLLPLSPPLESRLALYVLANSILQPIRDKFGVVNVNSGFRSRELNTRVGGASHSQHMKGEAADISITVSLDQVWNWIHEHLRFGQNILYEEKNFIHVSLGFPFIKQTLSQHSFRMTKS